tara:strand:- start:319 stop:591 length:273 start_codon:yes stop_codon:yes gene_type:complete
MRGPAIALVTMVQCFNTVDDPIDVSTWTREERIAFLYPNAFFLILLAVIAIWTLEKIVNGKVIIDDLDALEEENELRRELRRHSRYRYRR